MRVFMLLVVVSCGQGLIGCARPCEATCTSGCCDGNGKCQGGRLDSMCGSAGRTCLRCVGTTCNATGFCSPGASSGGGAGSTGGGGGGSAACVGVGATCIANNDCCTFRSGTGFCVSGRCADACTANADCNSGCCATLVSGNRACNQASACGGTTCRAAGATCATNGECCSFRAGDGFCVDGACADGCSRNSQCVSGCCGPLIGGGAVCSPPQFCP